MASAVVVAAAEAVKDIVKEKMHETLNPEPAPDALDEADSEPLADSDDPRCRKQDRRSSSKMSG